MKPKLPLLAAVYMLAALSPASALAVTGNWSSPVQVVPPGADPLGAAPSAFVTTDGRSLALSADGLKPLVTTGDVRGTFGKPVALGLETPKTVGVDGAVGPDGTLAVTWSAEGVGHLTLLQPDQGIATVDLPGAGVSGAAVAVAPDGSVTVAYRTKEGQNTYKVLAATAPAGGSLGEPVTLDSGTAGIDSPAIAAGPGGAVAVVYRKLAPRYRVYAVVRPAGAASFEAPQPLASSTQADSQPRVVFDSDGTIVAAWGNPETGPSYALRVPGPIAFQAPVRFSPGGDDTSTTMDLVSTPQGGAAATWAGNGVVRTAVQPAGGTFGAPVQAGTYTGNIVAQPAVAVAPDGTVTVVVAHPQDGAVHATDVGGASTLVGYGQPETVTPVSVAASADRTVALWRNPDGGISAATRSAVAPPSTGPGPKPTGPDKVAPKVTYVGKAKRITFRKVPTSITFKVRCSESCALSGAGSLRTTGAAGKTRVAPLPPYTASKPRTGTQTIRWKLGSFATADLRRALRARRGGRLFLDIRARDAAGNEGRLRLQLSLVPRR